MHVALTEKRAAVGITTLVLVGLLGFSLTASAQTYNNNYNDDDNGNEGNGAVYDADLSGDNEVPEVSSGVTGYAGVWVGDDDGEGTNYWLDVFDGEDVMAAHLHCASEGENGPVVVELFEHDDGVDIDGRLAEGDITDSDIENSGEDCDDTIGYGISDLGDLIRAIEAGDIYVNVHTDEYPDGAARGQLEFSEDTGNGNGDDDRDDKGDRKGNNDDRKHDDKDMKDRDNDNRHDDDKKHHDNDWDSRRDSNHNYDRDNRSGNDGKDGKDGRDGKDGKDGNNKSSSSRNHDKNHDLDVRGVLNNLKSMVFGH